MHWTRLWGRGICRWGVACALLLCAQVETATAQRRPGGRGDLPGGRPSRNDPTDPARRDAALQRKADRYYQAGQRLLAQGKIKRAIPKFKSVIELVGTAGLGQASLSQLMTFHQQGIQALDQVRKLIEGKQYRDALKLAKETRTLYSNLFGGIEAAGEMPNISRLAVGLIKTIEKNPAAKIEIQEYEASKRAKKIPRQRRQAKKDPKLYLNLYKTLGTLAKRYPDCPTGKRCAREASKLRQDKKIWRIIQREHERRFIASTLSSIEQFEKAGLSKEAAEEYKKLKHKYPTKSLEQLRKMAEG
ncbi:MAG: hypothetical protein ACE5EQ_00540 [Phycisphaerae bacterium]